jgi:Ser/Thr protein kinase RdoA (MazF antagonist)
MTSMTNPRTHEAAVTQHLSPEGGAAPRAPYRSSGPLRTDAQTELLRRALATTAGQGFNPADYDVFLPVGGGTQATVWRGHAIAPGVPDVAVRLTPKPELLIARIAAQTNKLTAVPVPRTLAVARLITGTRIWTVQVCTWIGNCPANPADTYRLGQDIARLHRALAEATDQFTDRPLSFDHSLAPATDQELPVWHVARQLWRHHTVFARAQEHLRMQPIHGDLHAENIVACGNGHGFIDFDKVMCASRAFDLAKLITTACFTLAPGSDGGIDGIDGTPPARARFQQRRAADLLAGYQSIQPLTEGELTAIEGFSVLLNAETARLGILLGNQRYRTTADAIGAWWINRHRYRRSNPLGIHPTIPGPSTVPTTSGPGSTTHLTALADHNIDRAHQPQGTP